MSLVDDCITLVDAKDELVEALALDKLVRLFWRDKQACSVLVQLAVRTLREFIGTDEEFLGY